MSRPVAVIAAWLPEGQLPKLIQEFPQVEFLDGRQPADLDRHLPRAAIAYGLPPVPRLGEGRQLRWIQLISAGVPHDLGAAGRGQSWLVTNLAGLYGTTIAEHALALMSVLVRNLHRAFRQQLERKWDRTIMQTMGDLHGRTLAIVGLGSIGQGIARLARAYGMRVIGCRRVMRETPFVDQVFPCTDLRAMLAEADIVAVAAPHTRLTEGMLGPGEFQAMKRGAIYINVSRGPIAQEKALVDALQSGHLAGAGLDVFAVEPLPADHVLWTLSQVLISPHYSGETVNQSALPAERFARNLHAWLAGRPLEGVVDLEQGY